MSLFPVFAVLHLILFLFTFSRHFNAGIPLYFLRLLLLSLAVDNTVVALGTGYQNADWYAGCTRLRYGLHALVLPGLALYGLSLLSPPRARWLVGVVSLLALGSLSYGAWHEIVLLELVTSPPGQPPRLVGTQAGPPWATVLANLVFLCLAAAVWYRSRWPWAFLGGLLILLVNGAMVGNPHALLAGALAELVFVCALLGTEMQRQQILAAADGGIKRGEE